MVDNLLYFPYINLPQSDWCTRVLLYWDNIGVVAPSFPHRDLSLLRPYMRDLTEAGLVTPIHLDFEREELRRFTGSFFETLDLEAARHRLTEDPQRTIGIHFEKFQYGLVDNFRKSGVATSAGLDVRIEETTGLRYLAGLAAVLSNSSASDYVPATDDRRCLDALTGGVSGAARQSSFFTEAEGFRTAILQKVLPAPVGGVPALELAKFKERHGEALGRFRKSVERIVLDLASSGDRYVTQRLDVVGEEIQDEADEIRGAMRSAGWHRIGLGSFCSIFVPAISTFATGVVSGHIAAAISGASILPPVLSAFQQRREIQEKIRTSPFAYAAFANARFGP